MATINLLPWRERRRQRQKRNFLMVWGAAASCAIFVVIIMHVLMSIEITQQKKVNSKLVRETKTLTAKIEKIKNIEKERDNLIARMQIIQRLQHDRPLTVHVFEELVTRLPAGVYFEQVTRNDNMISVIGRANSNSSISALMRSLEASQFMEHSVLTEIKSEKSQSTGSHRFLLRFRQAQVHMPVGGTS